MKEILQNIYYLAIVAAIMFIVYIIKLITQRKL